MAGNVLRRIMNGVVHQIDCGIGVIEVRPSAQGSVRPCCVSSGLQLLIGSRVPGRIGPTPRQHFPVTAIWRHTRVWRGGIDDQLIRSIDDLFCVKLRKNVASLPQNPLWGAFSRYRASFAESQGSRTRFPRIRRDGQILNATEVTSAPERIIAVASWMRRRRSERGLSGLKVQHLQPLSKMTFLALRGSLSRCAYGNSPQIAGPLPRVECGSHGHRCSGQGAFRIET